MMGVSYSYFKKEVREYLVNRFDRDSSILDVGCGSGTYYNLLGDYFENIEGVEVFKGYIDKYDLENKYKKIYNENIRNMEYEYYDIIIFGDILEHLEVEEAKRVLDYALDRCKEVIVALPYCYEQGECNGNRFEIHKQSDLTKENVLERYPRLKLLYGNEEYGYYIKKN